jgi:hypothetical protein
MVQVLPQEQGLGALLGLGMSQGIQTSIQDKRTLMNQLALEKQKQQMKDEGFSKLLDSLGFGDMGQPQQGQQELAPEAQQQESSQQQQVSPVQQGEMQLEKMATNPALMLALANKNPAMATQIQSMYGNLLKKREASAKETISPEKKERLTETVSEQLKKLKGGNIGLVESGSKFSSEAREDRAFFDNLSMEIEGLFAGMVGKGTLNKQRFEYLQKRLPNSKDTKAKTIGKLKAIAKEFNLDIPGLNGNKQSSAQQKDSGTQSFNVEGKTYNIPADQVEDFKKEMGIQ